MFITSSILYDYTQCPHRVWRDVYGPKGEMAEEVNPFVRLLWEKGVLHEKKIIGAMGEYADLSEGAIDERCRRTLEEMKKGAPLIYQGVLKAGDLLGIPDLLRKNDSGEYTPIDIKSGMGLEGINEDPGKGGLKKHYAVQLGLYIEILRILGFKEDNRGLILDIRGNEVVYDLDRPRGPRYSETWNELYGRVKEEARSLLEGSARNTPALSGVCKLCHWYESCRRWCERNDDLSLIFAFGRGKRDLVRSSLGVSSVGELRSLEIESLVKRKRGNRNFLKGIGEKTLRRTVKRADILRRKGSPEIYSRVELPRARTEFFFDIEDDPTQDFIYLHGLYKREDGGEGFVYFFAVENTSEQEKNAWEEFWEYIRRFELAECAVYYYSQHEKTAYKRLREKYPEVVSEQELEAFFCHPNVIDLYRIICANTDWPLSSYSVKDLAGYLGFKWRDSTPSGVLSIQWFNEYLLTASPDVFKRIIEYNEDDCRATMVLKDGLVRLSGEKFGRTGPQK